MALVDTRHCSCAVLLFMLFALASGQSLKAALDVVQTLPTATAAVPRRILTSSGKRYLAPHNAARKLVKSPNLKWDKTLATAAQKWANNLASTTCTLIHKKPNIYGENLFSYSDSAGIKTKGLEAMAVNAWVAEGKDYTLGVFPNTCNPGKVCGHYTQVVWKDTKKVGCGYALCNSKTTVIVACEYSPPGNWIGEKPY